MRGRQTNFGHITKLLAQLIEKGCIQSGDTNREGTLYNVRLPEEIPLVGEKIRNLMPQRSQDDYFSDPKKRAELFERDKWICQYCGEKVTAKNATLDHYIPQCKGGTGTKENLKLCCLVCNGIKSGRTYEEAAPFILKKIQQHKIQLASSSADQRAFPDSGVA
ncbi:MAG: HNH endonuclease [Candidatus Omnitrophica bacterium]|nr:HNH endonuclease [Candidatus Omnitrophota bacterium]